MRFSWTSVAGLYRLLQSFHATVLEDREMASALEQLLGANVVDGSGKSVAVSSLVGNDKVVGQ